jgi:hypothetical protein
MISVPGYGLPLNKISSPGEIYPKIRLISLVKRQVRKAEAAFIIGWPFFYWLSSGR